METTDDLSNFLKFLYEDNEGFVYVATRDSNYSWNQEFFEWPKQKVNIKNFITLQGETKDVYVAPALFKTKNSLKKTVKGSSVVWVEFDGQQQIDFQDLPYPDLIVQTSVDTHLHCYWKTAWLDDPVKIESINRRLTHYLEADSSGWDANQVLRPPLSKNWKHEGLPVTVKHYNDGHTSHSFESFNVAPEVISQPVFINSDSLEDPKHLLSTLPLPGKLKKKLISETAEHPYRSSFLMRLGYELAEQRCNHLQIVSLLSYVDDRVGKFTGRKDKLLRLSEIASRALLEYAVEEGVQLYSPLDIVNHKENLDWILQGWLHHQGFLIVSGQPSVGKTSFCLQMVYHLATATEFFKKPIVKQQKILFMSLEMGVLELKYFFEKHQTVFKSNHLWDTNIRILDEDLTLIEYETIIEEYNPDIVLIDSLSELAKEELKESEARAITRWIRRLRRRHNCAFIVIHHNRKDSNSSKKSGSRVATLSDLYGSYIFAKDVDTVFFMERDEEDSSKLFFYSLKTRYSKRFDERLTQDQESLLYSIEEQNDENNLQQGAVQSGGSLDLNLGGISSTTASN